MAVFAGWQLCTHKRTRYPYANARVGRTTHNAEQATLPHINLTNTQAVCIRVLLGRFDLAHHDLAKGRRDRLELFDLQAGHGQHIGQLTGGERRVAEFAQPGFRELHKT